jgi:hypothetical protein
MPEPKGNRGTKGASQQGRKEPTSELIPSHPLSARDAVIQVVLLIGIPLILLLLAKVVLHQFFPSLGY